MKTKTKTKGNLKGTFKGKSGPEKKCSCNCGCKSPEIPVTFDLNLKQDFVWVPANELEERLRRIIREELDKKLNVTFKDFWETPVDKSKTKP